jgi:haloacetate dehalogenase
MFDGFRLGHVDVGEVRLRVRYGGSGPAVLRVHGHPRTHRTWYAVAPALVEAGYSVVCPDLRGYGDSTVHRTASITPKPVSGRWLETCSHLAR